MLGNTFVAGGGFDHLWSEEIPGTNGMAISWLTLGSICAVFLLLFLLALATDKDDNCLLGIQTEVAAGSSACCGCTTFVAFLICIGIWRSMMAPVYEAGIVLVNSSALISNASFFVGEGFDHLWSEQIPGTNGMAIAWLTMGSLCVIFFFLFMAVNDSEGLIIAIVVGCGCTTFMAFLICIGIWRAMMAPVYDVAAVAPPPTSIAPPPLSILSPPLPPPLLPPRPPITPPPTPLLPGFKVYNLFSAQLTLTEEAIGIGSVVATYLIFEVLALKFLIKVPILRRTSLYLVYVTVLSGNDFLSDVFYTFTQDFAHPALFGASVFFTFLPTVVYLTMSGLFRSLFGNLVPASVAFAISVVTSVFYSYDDGPPMTKLVLSESFHIARRGFKYVTKALHLKKGRLYKNNTLEGFMGTTLWVLLWVLPKFLLYEILGAAVCAGGIAICLLLAVGAPIVGVLVIILAPLLGIFWCIVHINFKLSIFPSATDMLYTYMQHDLPEPGSTRSLNLSFLTEIFFESVPELLLLVANEILLNSGTYQPNLAGVYQVASSLLAILSNVFPFLMWRIRLGSWNRAIEDVLYPVTQEQADLCARRAKHMERDELTQAEMIQLHSTKWPESPNGPPRLQRQVTSSVSRSVVLNALAHLSPFKKKNDNATEEPQTV